MPALNHLIVHVRDKERTATWLADLLGVAPPRSWGPFCMVEVDGGVTLDFCDEPNPQTTHYAFLVDDAAFDAIFARIQAADLPYWADPGRRQPGAINHHFGGRGVYWADPDGHLYEIITRPYDL